MHCPPSPFERLESLAVVIGMLGTDGGQPLRILSIPANHRYVHHALGTVPQVRVLSDPPVPGAPAGVWWPHPALNAEWVHQNRSRFDIAHVHFGFEGRTVEQLRTWVDSLAQTGKPLVVTVHDLELPHGTDQLAHRQRLGVLVTAAQAVVTLTHGAAQELWQRWRVRAVVLPHPRMAPTDRILNRRPRPHDLTRVGLHLKSLRANAAGVELVRSLTTAVHELHTEAPMALRLTVHQEVLADPEHADLKTELRKSAAAPHVTLEAVKRFSDRQFWHYLSEIDVSVLPHRWGTHSGWLEECLDLGVVPVVPRIGYLEEQIAAGPASRTCVYEWRTSTPAPVSLTTALREAHRIVTTRHHTDSRAWLRHRELTDARSAARHLELYRQAILTLREQGQAEGVRP